MTHDTTASAPVPLPLPGSGDWLAWVAERTEGQLAEARRHVEQVKTGSPDEVLAAWNRAETAIANAEVAHLWSEVHPDAAVRDRADELSQEVQKYVTELGQDRELFAVFDGLPAARPTASTTTPAGSSSTRCATSAAPASTATTRPATGSASSARPA